jgi:hypothetical protein
MHLFIILTNAHFLIVSIVFYIKTHQDFNESFN